MSTIKSLQHEKCHTNISLILPQRIPQNKTSYDSYRSVFHQIKLLPHKQCNNNNEVIIPISNLVVSSPTKPVDPSHIGEVFKSTL